MKRWILGLAAIIVLCVILLYIFVPASISVSNSVKVHTSTDNIHRFIANESRWSKWWPSGTRSNYSYNDIRFSVAQTYHRIVELNIVEGDDTTVGSFVLTPLRADSSEITFQATTKPTNNPAKRLQRYHAAIQMQEAGEVILKSIYSFLSEEQNIYGIPVKMTTVKDTLLLSTKKTYAAEPGTDDLYKLISDLREYIQKAGGKETGHPMLNRKKAQGNNIEIMIAIPVNKVLPETSSFTHKRMVPLKILETEVKGGLYAVREAFMQLENYVVDHRFESPAIPFESLVTDRVAEKDTSKWITRIYYPVF